MLHGLKLGWINECLITLTQYYQVTMYLFLESKEVHFRGRPYSVLSTAPSGHSTLLQPKSHWNMLLKPITYSTVQSQTAEIAWIKSIYFIEELTPSLPRSSGCVWLRGELSEECAQHPDCLLTLHVHLCRGGGAALQGSLLLLHWWVQRVWAWLQVRTRLKLSRLIVSSFLFTLTLTVLLLFFQGGIFSVW